MGVATLASLVSMGANAEGYAGLGFAHIDYDVAGFSGNIKTQTVMARIGYKIIDRVGVEVQAGTKTTTDEKVFGNDKVALSVNSLYGVFARIDPFQQGSVHPYILLGAARLDSVVNIAGAADSRRVGDVSPAYALGMAISLYSLTVNVEHAQYFDKEDVEVAGTSLSLMKSF